MVLKYKIVVEEIEVEITRKPIKGLIIKALPPDGKVVCSAPLKAYSDDEIKKFISSKIHRIRKIQAKAQAHVEKTKLPECKKERTILSKQLEEKIAEKLPRWEEKMGRKCSGWGISSMKSRWGVCNVKTKKLTFSLMLAAKSDEFLEYVIVHELAHLFTRFHGDEFKQIMTQHLPNWKEIRKRNM